MATLLENILEINGTLSHDELVRYMQAWQKMALIWALICCISVCKAEFGTQHPLFSFIQSMPTLEFVEFSSYNGEKASIDAFLDAISQNHSIHTVDLSNIDCSAYAIQKLMEQKMKWKVRFCHFIGHPPTLNEFTSYVEELFIRENDLSVMDFMARIQSWPFLCQLSIKGILLGLQVVHLLEHIIPAVPILQELTMHNIQFKDPDKLQSITMIVCNAPCPDLQWHLNDCRFYPNTMLLKENIVKSEKAKLMRIKLTLQQFLNETAHYQMLRTILSESLHVGNSDISDEYGDMLDILPFL